MLSVTPTPVELIDDDTATKYFNEIDSLTGTERESRAEALRLWADQKDADQKREQFDTLNKIYSDFDGYVNDAGLQDFDEDSRYRTANRQFIASQFDQTPEEQQDIYSSFRDKWTESVVGKKGMSEKETFDLIKQGMDARNEVSEAANQIPGDIALSLFDSIGGNDPVDVPKLIETWKTKNAESIKKLPPGWEAPLLESAQAFHTETEGMLRDYAEPLKKVYDHLAAVTGRDTERAGETNPKNQEEMDSMVDTLASMPKPVRERAYASVVLGAQKAGQDPKKFMEQWGESWSRTLNMVRTGALTAQEMAAESDLRMLEDKTSPPDYYISKSTGEKIPLANRAFYDEADLRKVTPEEIAAEADEARQKVKRFEVVRELQSVADNQFDPIEKINKGGFLGFMEAMAYGSPQGLAYTATALVPVVGPYIAGTAIFADEYNQLREQGMSVDQAVQVGSVSAGIQAGLERTGAKLIFGKLPVFEKLMRRIANPARVGKAGSAGIRFFSAALGENITEGAQDLTTPLVQDIAEALGADVPDVQWQPILEKWGGSRLDVLAATIPTILLGTGVATLADNKRFAQFEERQDIYRSMGMDDATIKKIEDGKDLAEVQQNFQSEFGKLTPENVKAGIAYMEGKIASAKDQQEDPNTHTLTRETLTDGSKKFVIRDPKGDVKYTTSDEQTAQIALSELLRTQITGTTRGIFESISFFNQMNEAAGRGEDVQKFLLSNAPRNLLTDYEANPTEQNLNNLFETVRAFGQDISEPAELANFPVLASNQGVLAEGIFKSVIQINEGATGDKVVRDVAQDNLKRAIAEQRITMEWVRENLNQIIPQIDSERITGYRLRTETDTDVIESFSDVALAYMVGDVREEQIPEGFRGFLRRMAIIVKDIYRRAYNLKRLVAEGKVDANFETLLADSVGLNQQARVDTASNRVSKDIITDGGQMLMDFSIGSRTNAVSTDTPSIRASNATIIGPANYSIGAFHGTPHKVDKFSTAKIGTGEGAQAYGWGLYFAEEKKVATGYRDALSGVKLLDAKGEVLVGLTSNPVTQKILKEAQSFWKNGETTLPSIISEITQRKRQAELWASSGSNVQSNTEFVSGSEEAIRLLQGGSSAKVDGNLYTVDLDVEPEDLLDWDKPFSEQSPKVQAALKAVQSDHPLWKDTISGKNGKPVGGAIYKTLTATWPDAEFSRDGIDPKKKASEALLAAGIPGIRYLDGGSRSDGEGTYNYVAFDENLIKITEENGNRIPASQALAGPAPGVAVENGRAYSPIVRDLLQRRAAGEDIPRSVIDQAINDNFPAQLVEPPKTESELPSRATIDDAINEGQRRDQIAKSKIQPGEAVTIRQDVPAMTRKGVGVVTIKGKSGNSYDAAARISDPQFILNEKKSLEIGMGGAKGPHIAIRGKWSSDQSMPPDLSEWTQVGFNPDRHSFYYDRATMKQVVGGSEAYQIGNTVFVKDAQFGDGQISNISYSIGKKDSLRVKMTRTALTDAALNQASWKDWYEEHQSTLDEFFGDHAQLFQDILSVTSQAASVKANVGLALKAFGQMHRGEEFSGFLPAVIKNLNRLRENTQVQGQKISAYKNSNDGKVDEAVIDRHIARLIFGVDSPSKAQFAKAQKILTEIANEIGWTPRQVQAALWAHSIYKSGKTPESYGAYLKKLESRGTLAERIGDIGSRSGTSNADGRGRGRFAPESTADGAGLTNYSIASVEHFKNDKRFDKLVKDGRVVIGHDIEEFKGMHILLHSPDNAFAGTIKLTDGEEIEGKGGVYYPALYANKNYFWASTEATVMTTAKHLNEIGQKNGGKILMGLVSAPVEKLFSSTSMATGVVKFLNSLTSNPKAGLSKEDLNSMLVAASKVQFVKKGATPKKFSMTLAKGDGLEKNLSKVDALLEPTKSIFQVRKMFSESLADQLAKHLKTNPESSNYVAGILADAENKHAKSAIKRGTLSKASIMQGLGNLFTEPFLRDFQDHGNGKIYAVLEVDGMVDGVASKAHDSYPFTLVPRNKKSKVKLHVLNQAVDWQDVVGRETGEYTTPEERIFLMPTSGMSAKTLKVLGVKGGSKAIPLNYSIASQSEIDRVNKALGGMNRGPDERLKVYERAKQKFSKLMAWNSDELAAMADTGSDDSQIRRTQILQGLGELDGIMSVLPPEVRGRVGGYTKLAGIAPHDVFKDGVKVSEVSGMNGAIISAWMREGQNIGQAGKQVSLPPGYTATENLSTKRADKAIADFFRDRIKKIDAELEKVLVREYTEAIAKAVKQSRPKAGDNGVRKSTLGAETQKFADMVQRATLLDDEATPKRMAEIEAALANPDATAEDISALSEEWSILNTFGDLDNRSSETLAQGLDWLKGQLQMGREAWRIKEQARIDEQRARAAATIEWLGKGTAKKRFADKGLMQRIAEVGNNYLLDHASFEQFVTAMLPPEIAANFSERLRKADMAAQSSEIRDGKGILDAVREGAKAANMSAGDAMLWLKGDQKNAVAYLEGRKVKDERIAIDLAQKIVTGEADRSKLTDADVETLRNELAALPADTQKEYVTIKRVIFRGEDVKLDMSRAKAIQLLLSWSQPDVQIKMRKEGWTDESATDLKALVNDPVSRSVVSYLQSLYGKGAGIVNPVYSRMFGMTMPQVKNYAPTRFLNAKDSKDIGLDGSPTATGTTPGFAKSRVTHSAKIAPEDALTVAQGHIAQQAHWVHFAELAREFRALLSSPDVRESLKQTHGDAVLKSAELWADQLEQRGGNKARESAWLNNVIGTAISGKAVASLGFNLKTLAMQLENTIRFGLSLDMKQIASALSQPGNIIEDIQTVWESDAIQNRLQGGATAEARFLFSRYAGKPNFAAKIAEASMTPINWLDSAGTSISSAIVYRANLNDALDAGMPENLAKQAALNAASEAIYRFAQPVSFGQKSIIENNGNVFAKTFFLFMSDPRLKTAILADAARGLATGRGNTSEHIRRIVAVELMALVSHVISSAFKDTFSDDDDEEIWGIGGFAKAMLLAPFQGFFFAGSVAEVALSKLTGQGYFTSSQNPLLNTAESAIRAGSNLDDAFNFSDPEAMLKEWNNIFRSMALSPSMAVFAVLLNMVKPVVGLYQNATTED